MNLQAETTELIAPMPFSMAENGELARHMLETAVEYKELRMMTCPTYAGDSCRI